MTDEWTIRRDCAFCGRERSARDDNHGPECPYWDFFGPRPSQLPEHPEPVVRWFQRFAWDIVIFGFLFLAALAVLVVSLTA